MDQESIKPADKEQAHRRRLVLILAIYVLLALGYAVVNPLFEAPDEHAHYFTSQRVVETGKLPIVDREHDPWSGQEAAQPPLYYLLAAAIIKPIDAEGAREDVWRNPQVQLGDAGSPMNINAFVHTPVEDWPWQGYVLSAHLVRFLSVLLGLGTLMCVYGSGRLIWPAHAERVLLATSLVAFLPQFAFLHGSISNDSLIILLSAATICQLLRLWYDSITWRRLLLLGATIGLAILSKMAGLLLLAYALGFVALAVWREQRSSASRNKLKRVFMAWLAVLVPALILSGWLLWRNWQLYGDITATSQFVGIAGGDREYSLLQVLRESRGLWASLFAVFGWFNVLAPGWVYLIWNGIVSLAIIGALLQIWRYWKSGAAHLEQVSPQSRRRSPQSATLLDRPGVPAALLAGWVVLVYAGLVYFMLRTPAAQGRLLFPALVPLALGLAYGLDAFRRRAVYLLIPGLALLTSVYSLLFVIPSSYEAPPVITEEDLPAEARMIDVGLGEGLRLVAAQKETMQAQAGDWVWATIYWQADNRVDSESMQEAPMYVLELFGQDEALLGKAQSYHGGGLYPASLWSTGDIVVDRVAVELRRDISSPVQARLNMKLAGGEASIDMDTLKVVPEVWPEAADTVLAQVDGIDLAGAAIHPQTVMPGDSALIELRWQVREAPGRDLTTFVHLGDPSQPPLAQGDSVPLGGHYPTTLWASGEVFSDTYELAVPSDLPPGLYPVLVGLYEPDSGLRQALSVDGTRQANDAFLVGWLEVSQ